MMLYVIPLRKFPPFVIHNVILGGPTNRYDFWSNKKVGNYVIRHNFIWANKKTEYFVYHWVHAHTIFEVTCFPTFVRASKDISSVMLIC